MKYSNIKEIVQNLRRNLTPAEKKLWAELRNKKLAGEKFLRQHPIFYDRNLIDHRFFVADFYCSNKKLVVELDGKIHEYQKERDKWRDGIIESKGIKIIRIKNEELKEIERVLEKIKHALEVN
jgi:very-short-patch-repair endonuclease